MNLNRILVLLINSVQYTRYGIETTAISVLHQNQNQRISEAIYSARAQRVAMTRAARSRGGRFAGGAENLREAACSHVLTFMNLASG